MQVKFGKTVLELIKGDITEMDTDAIVNAANSKLQHGGGVAGAILKKGGATIQEESNTWVRAWGGEISVGATAITSGGNLKARYVIHAVGPRMGEGDEDEKLKRATMNSLKTAEKHNLKSIAFPAISTGIFHFPVDRCAEIMLSTTIDYLQSEETKLQRVIYCLYNDEIYSVFEETLKALG